MTGVLCYYRRMSGRGQREDGILKAFGSGVFGDPVLREGAQLPPRLIAVVCGLLTAMMSVVPLWFANKISARHERRVGRLTMLAVLTAQGVGIVCMAAAFLICAVIAKPTLLWFAIPTVGLWLMVNVAFSFWIVRSRRRRG